MNKKEYKKIFALEKDYWWYKGLHELVLKTIKNYSSNNNISILDAGCGTGRMMELLNKFGEVSGIDYSEDAVRFSKKRGLKNVKMIDLNNWNKNEKSYDIVVCLDVLYHSGIKDDIEIIRKFYSALNNKGILILNNPAFNILRRHHDLVVSTKRRYRKNGLVKKIKDIGFNIRTATYRLPYLFIIIIIIKKLLPKISSPNQTVSDLVSLPVWLNKLLLSINRIENKFILRGINMPFGSSLFIVAKKN